MAEFNIENGELQELSLGPHPTNICFFFKFIVCRIRFKLMNEVSHLIIYVVNVLHRLSSLTSSCSAPIVHCILCPRSPLSFGLVNVAAALLGSLSPCLNSTCIPPVRIHNRYPSVYIYYRGGEAPGALHFSFDSLI